MFELLAAIPQAPTHEVMPKGAEWFFTIFLFIPLGFALGMALRHLAIGKGPLLLYCVIGGSIAVLFEPIVDTLGHVYLKENNAIGTFTSFDRTMPLYVCFVYPWYVGGLGYLAYRLYERGVTVRHLLVLWAVDATVDVFLESPGILTGTFLYYGDHPFNPWGFPFWWAMVNPIMPMAAGAMIYKMRPHLKGWRLAAVIPMIPMADGLANGATAWPMWTVLNLNDPPMWAIYMGGFATLGLALLAVRIIGEIVGRPAEEVPAKSVWETLRGIVFSKGEPEEPRVGAPPDEPAPAPAPAPAPVRS